MKENNNFYKNIYDIPTKNTENGITKQLDELDEECETPSENKVKTVCKKMFFKLVKKIKNASKVQKIAMVWGLVILVLVLTIVIRSSLADYSKGNNKGGLVDELSSCIDEMETILETGMTEEELLALRVETEKKEEKYVPKKLKKYENEIQTEETAFRMQPGQERSINVTLNLKGAAKVYIKSKSEDVSIIENDVLDFLYGHFRNLSKDKPLIIAGVSMGGYGAMYHYLNNTSKYDACIALSPATRPDHIDESKYGTLKDLFLREKDNKLNCYISIGEKDFIIDASRQFDKFLIDNNIGVSYKYVPDYAHEWGLWEKEVKSIFDYLNSLGLKG